METKDIERSICIEHCRLNSDIFHHLNEKSRELLTTSCSKEDGYILSVNKLVQVLDNKISSSNATIIFKLKLNVNVLKPEVGKTYKGKITMILSQGIFVEVLNKLKIIITCHNLKEFDYDKTKNTFTKDTLVFKKGDEIDVTISAIRFEKNNFSCIGILI